jgi:hypothetical protein
VKKIYLFLIQIVHICILKQKSKVKCLLFRFFPLKKSSGWLTITTPMSIGGVHYDTDEYWWLPLRHQWVLVVTITTPMSIGGYHYDTDEYWWCPCCSFFMCIYFLSSSIYDKKLLLYIECWNLIDNLKVGGSSQFT